jgi:MFS family permease
MTIEPSVSAVPPPAHSLPASQMTPTPAPTIGAGSESLSTHTAPLAEPVKLPTIPASRPDSAVAEPTAPAEPVPGTVALSPAEVRQGLKISTIEGGFAAVHLSITGAVGGSVFLTGFALLLGADNFAIGVLSALPFIGQVFQFVGAYLEERIGNRNRLVLYTALIGRMIWAFLLALPFLGAPGPLLVTIFFVGLALSYAFIGIAANAWLSWMTDLVPPRRRGSYFGVRNTVLAVATIAGTYGAGAILDAVSRSVDERTGYAIIFGIAVITAVGSAMLIARQPEPLLKPKPVVRIKDLIGAPLRDRSFRRYVLIAAVWAMAIGIAAPFFNVYALNDLGMSFTAISLTFVIMSGVGLITTPLVGKLQDSLGDRMILSGSALGSAIIPWVWVIATPDNLLPVWIGSALSGVFWPGITQGLINVLMERAPRSSLSASMAVYSAVTGMGTLAAGLLGGVLATAMAGMALTIGPLFVNELSFLFILTSISRVTVAWAFWRTLR